MAKVLLDMAVSIDGFVGGSSGEDVGLYDWYFNPSEMSRPVIEELIETTGAIVLGRGAYGTGEDSAGLMTGTVRSAALRDHPSTAGSNGLIQQSSSSSSPTELRLRSTPRNKQRVIATQPSEAAPTSRGSPGGWTCR